MGEFLGQPLTSDKVLDVCAYWDEEAKYNRKGMYVFNQSNNLFKIQVKILYVYICPILQSSEQLKSGSVTQVSDLKSVT